MTVWETREHIVRKKKKKKQMNLIKADKVQESSGEKYKYQRNKEKIRQY